MPSRCGRKVEERVRAAFVRIFVRGRERRFGEAAARKSAKSEAEFPHRRSFSYFYTDFISKGMELYMLIRKAWQKVGSETRLLQRDSDIARGKRGFRRLLEMSNVFCDGAEATYGDRTCDGPIVVSAHIYTLHPLRDGTFIEYTAAPDAWRAVRLLPDGAPVYEAAGGAALPFSRCGHRAFSKADRSQADGRETSDSDACPADGRGFPDPAAAGSEER